MAIKVSAVETIFNDPSAFRTKIMITPNDRLTDLGMNFNNKLKLKVKLKNNGMKNTKSWKELAEVRVSGYGTFEMTSPKSAQKIKAGIAFKK